jgi:hypothetical protein
LRDLAFFFFSNLSTLQTLIPSTKAQLQQHCYEDIKDTF